MDWQPENTRYIVGHLEVFILDQYFECFTENDRVGHFFRKLNFVQKDNKIVGSNVVIGKNTLFGYPKQIALKLELPNCAKFTSHSLKRSGITFMANSGMNVTEIKKHTGHKSDKVVEGYVFNSMAQKRKASDALCVGSNLPIDSSLSQVNNIQQTSNASSSASSKVTLNFTCATFNITGNFNIGSLNNEI